MKDSYYLKHDTNASHDPKMEAMIQRYGMAGYGRFWRLVEILREQTDGKIPRKKWGLATLARCWHCNEEKAEDFVVALVDDFELIASDGESIWSERLCRDMKRLADQREAGKKFALEEWIRRKNGKPKGSHRVLHG